MPPEFIPPESMPDYWQTVHRLLLLGSFQSQETFTSLYPALQGLRQNLPSANIVLLCFHTDSLPANRFPKPSLFDIQIISSRYWNTETSLATLLEQEYSLSLIQRIRDYSFDAAIIFTEPYQSPYVLSYLCYLAGIPIRLGQSREFGGSVLSTCINPPLDEVPLEHYYLHLLQSLGISQPDQNREQIQYGTPHHLPVSQPT